MELLQVEIKHAGYTGNKEVIKDIDFSLSQGQLFLLTLLILFVFRRIHKRGSFFEDVVNEQEEKLKYAILLLQNCFPVVFLEC